MVSYVQRFSYFDPNKVGTEILYEDIGPMLAADGPSSLVPWLTELIKRDKPKLIVIDSFRAIHDLRAFAPGDAPHGVRPRRAALRIRLHGAATGRVH